MNSGPASHQMSAGPEWSFGDKDLEENKVFHIFAGAIIKKINYE